MGRITELFCVAGIQGLRRGTMLSKEARRYDKLVLHFEHTHGGFSSARCLSNRHHSRVFLLATLSYSLTALFTRLRNSVRDERRAAFSYLLLHPQLRPNWKMAYKLCLADGRH